MRSLQCTYPVIFLSLAKVKGEDFATQREQVNRELVRQFYKFQDLNSPQYPSPAEQRHFESMMSPEMSDAARDVCLPSITNVVHQLLQPAPCPMPFFDF